MQGCGKKVKEVRDQKGYQKKDKRESQPSKKFILYIMRKSAIMGMGEIKNPKA